MPTIDFASTSPHPLRRYDVVGQYIQLEENPSQPVDAAFVQHVGLHDQETEDVRPGQRVAVIDMGPPLATTDDSKNDDMVADVAVSLPLTIGEIREIQTWFQKHKDEYADCRPPRARQFIVHPPSAPAVNPLTGVRKHTRFSCVGFVLEAYGHGAGIPLLHTDDACLPVVDDQMLAVAYPPIANASQKARDRLGLPGTGPWRVVLPGYVLHAMKRDTAEIRREKYTAKKGDECFP